MKSKALVGTLSALILALVIPLIGAAQNKAPQDWTTKDLKQAIATAKTAADHKTIASYYTADAARLEAEAKDHAELADLYRKSPNLHEQKHPMSGQTAAHCQFLADRYKEMAQQERDLAKLHEDMAKP
jgi:hypothetical protein